MVLKRYIFLFPFFIFATQANAETFTYTVADSGTSVYDLGDSNAHYGLCTPFQSMYDGSISEVHIFLKKDGNPKDSLYGYIYNYDTAVIVGTSTNTILGSTTPTTISENIFYFASTTIYENSKYCVGLERTGASGGNSYDIIGSNTDDIMVGCYRTLSDIYCNTKTNTDLRISVLGDYDIICNDGAITCDMASTTEAIYTIGSTIQVYIGVFIMLVFGYIAFVFTRKFIQ